MVDEFISNESFLEYLRKMALAKKDPESSQHIIEGPHPSKEMLYDYVLNWAEKNVEEYVMDHIASCPQCSQEVLDIMEIERELDDDLIDGVDRIPLTQKIKNLISDLSFSVYSFPVGALATRSERAKHKKRYAIGESFVFCIPVITDGYLVILQYDANEEIVMVSPSNSKDDGFVPGGNEKKISGKVTGPVGKQFFKVFWTSQKVLNTENIDFQNKESVEAALNGYIELLANLDLNDWCETVYEYEVLK